MSIVDGTLLLAAPAAAVAGAVSFLSPCVLPLVPGYLSYVTGLTGRQLAPAPAAAAAPVAVAVAAGGSSAPSAPGAGPDPAGPAPQPVAGAVAPPRTAPRRRVLLGATLFVLGFSAVFVLEGALFGGIGEDLRIHQRILQQVLGSITIVLGLAFSGLVERIPLLSREVRWHRLPAAGLAGAPVLGVLFGIGWTPCIGPTLAAVLGLSVSSDGATAARGALLTFVYCLGLGVPFLLTGLAVDRAAGLFAAVRRHYRLVMLLGGGLLVAVGILEVSGAWQSLVIWMKSHDPSQFAI